MPISDASLLRIVSQSTPLKDRFHRKTGGTLNAQDHMDRWKRAAAFGNDAKFQERLAWEDLDLESARNALADPDPLTLFLPAWAGALRTALDHELTEETFPMETPAPFQDAFFPLVFRVTGMLGRAHLSPVLIQSARSSLLSRLAALCDQALEAEFTKFRPFGLELLARFIPGAAADGECTHYAAFCKSLREGGLTEIFERLPVLARLVGITVEFWIEETREFLDRLVKDTPLLDATFGKDRPLGEVTGIDNGLSDPHHRGKRVRIVKYSGGQKIVYKPRDLGLDAAWLKMLDFLNSSGTLLTLWHPDVLAMEGYGWMAFVPAAECADEAAAQRFYRRSGMLLCLAYIFQSNDFHRENVLASGEHLVLIDLETLCLPESRLSSQVRSFAATYQYMFHSVLSVGLLPRWAASAGGAYDLSGLGSSDEAEVFGEGIRWQQINTDRMHRGKQPIPVPFMRNSPVVAGRPAASEQFSGAIQQGFEEMYAFLMEHRREILSEDGPLQSFRGCTVRLLCRDTGTYADLMRATLAPQYLTNGVERSLELEVLNHAYLLDSPVEGIWRIPQAEIHDIEQLDVPYFSAATDSAGFAPDGETLLPEYFQRSGWDGVVRRVEKLSQEDMARQSAYIKASFLAKTARVGRSSGPAVKISAQARALGREELLDQALGIAGELRQQALIHGNEVNWIDLQLLPEAERYQLQLLGPGLYGGVTGIALFLSACYALTSGNAYRDLALGALTLPRNSLLGEQVGEEFSLASAASMGLGGGDGIGSLLFGLVRMAKLLNAPELLADARRIALLVDSEAVKNDQRLDLLLGCAGAAAGLLAVYEATGDELALRKAALCGDRLVTAQQPDGSWLTVDRKPLFGISHGAAGISYALTRLHAATRTQAYLSAALAGMRYERSGLDGARNNWPDLRSSDAPGFMAGWCHGAPGIGLARLGALKYHEDSAARADVDTALRCVNEGAQTAVDHICCGAFSHVDLLIEAGDHQRALGHGSSIVAQSNLHGGYRLFPTLPRSAKTFGLYQGLSGIGYELLRLVDPARIPSVLIWN